MSKAVKVPLSVIIISDRADQKLIKALESIKFADQIILVNTNPQLNLNPIASRFGLTLVQEPGPITDFSRIRNQALSHAKHDWVLYLDSDEWLTPESVPVVGSVIKRPHLSGVYVKRRDVFVGRELVRGEVGSVRLLRLAKRKSLKFNRPVHEVAKVSGATIEEDITIVHESHESVAEFLQTVNSYAQLEAHFRYASGERFSWLELAVYPVGKWILNSVFRLGLLDGWQGMTYVVCMSIHSLLVRIYLYELERARA